MEASFWNWETADKHAVRRQLLNLGLNIYGCDSACDWLARLAHEWRQINDGYAKSQLVFFRFPVLFLCSIRLRALLLLRNRENGTSKWPMTFPMEACHSLIFTRCRHCAYTLPSIITWCKILKRQIRFRYVAATHGYLVWSLDQGGGRQMRKRRG